MEYLERVIKETLRFMPVIPIIGRYIKKKITLCKNLSCNIIQITSLFVADGLELPAGANILIPIVQMNYNPEIWNNPDEFNPDRFLPEEAKKRHRCAFIPFSFGVRNCVGLKYAMINMKIFLAAFLNTYKITGVKYKNTEEIKLSFSVLIKAVDGCPVAYTRRTR